MDIVEKYSLLINAYKDDEEVLKFFADSMCKMPEYVNARVQHIINLTSYPGGESRSENVLHHLSKLDENRTKRHEAAICACAQLNRFCEKANIPLIFDKDLDNREDVALFASEVTIEFFDNERMYSRTSPEKLVDDMVFDKYYIDTNDKSLERVCHNAKIDLDDAREEEDLEDCL